MKMNVRKWLSAVLAVTLVAVMLPLSALTVSAADSMSVTTNLVTNGDFAYPETGDPTYWHGGTFGTAYGYDGTKGAQVTGGNMYQTVAVDQGCSYLLTFRAKVVSGEKFMVRVIGGDVYLEETCTNTDWAPYSFIVSVSGADEYAALSFVAAADATVYVDDVMLVLSGAAEKTVLKNGSFETGNASGWSLNDGTEVTTEFAHSGDYAIKTANTAIKYHAIGRQYFAVEQNTDYTLTFWYMYVGTNAAPSFYAYAVGSDKTQLKSVTTSVSAANSWAMVTLSFNSGTYDEVFVNLQNRTASDGGVYYFDDFAVAKVGDTSGSETPEVTNLITNSTFETGAVTGWLSQSSQKSKITADHPHTGAYSMNLLHRNRGLTAYQDVSVEADTNYIVSFYYKSIDTSIAKNMAFGVYATSATQTSATPLESAVTLNCTQSEWTLVTYSFNSGSNTSVRVGFGGTSSTSTYLYYLCVDDIIMVKQFTSFPEESIKGNFYSCNKQYTTIVPEQTYATAAEGKTYRVTFSARAMTNGFRLYVNQRTENGANVSDYTKFWSEDARGWTDISFICRSTTDELNLKVVNLGNGTLETNLYITDFEVTEIPDTPVDIIQFKGMSAREQAPDPDNITAGLGFLFRVNMKNAVTVKESDGHIYQTNTATAYPFTNSFYANDPYPYTVVRVGAIMSLDPDAANAGLTLESTAEDRSTIDVVGRKRWTYNDTDMANGYSYAVRIVNIPERHFGTTIYARPYVIVQAGERTVTLYGQMQQGTYESFFGTEA